MPQVWSRGRFVRWTSSSGVRRCDLDPIEYNVASAWHYACRDEWRAFRHGFGTLEALAQCDCPLCVEAHERQLAWEVAPEPPQIEPPRPPRTVPVAEVRAHVEQLLASGLSRRVIAERAELDATTIARLVRADVRRVRLDTADAVLAVSA